MSAVAFFTFACCLLHVACESCGSARYAERQPPVPLFGIAAPHLRSFHTGFAEIAAVNSSAAVTRCGKSHSAPISEHLRANDWPRQSPTAAAITAAHETSERGNAGMRKRPNAETSDTPLWAAARSKRSRRCVPSARCGCNAQHAVAHQTASRACDATPACIVRRTPCNMQRCREQQRARAHRIFPHGSASG